MAWQQPKTNWSAADGVRDDDFNRIESNILELRGDVARADITVHVSGTGSDTSGTGAEDAPYRTITKALSTLPKNLNGKAVTVRVAAGSYYENVVVKGFTGPITINGAYAARVNLDGFTVDGCTCIVDTIYIVLVGTGANIINGGTLIGTGSLEVSGANISLQATNGSRVSISNLNSEVAQSYAVMADLASHVYIGRLYGDDNSEGILVQCGSIVATMSTNITVMGDEVVSYAGGRYYTGGQDFSANTLVAAEVVD